MAPSTISTSNIMAQIKIKDGQSFEARGCSTLLDELENQGLDINYSCRSGFCGACKATLLSGDVTKKEKSLVKLAKDEILTCCSQATSDVELCFKEKVNVFQSSYAISI